MRRAAAVLIVAVAWPLALALPASAAGADAPPSASSSSPAAVPAAPTGSSSSATPASPSDVPSPPPPASSAPPGKGIGTGQIQFAAQEHDLGYRAYLGKDYDEAATHFENAFFAAPNAFELRNAIRARRAARELARAATLAAIGQRKFSGDAALMKLSAETIGEARPTVLEVKIESAVGFSVAVDDKLVVAEKSKSVTFYTAPGRHELLVSWADDRSKQTVVDGREGGSQSLYLDAPSAPQVMSPPPPPPTATTPPPPVPPPPTAAVLPPPPPPPAHAGSKPLGPTAFVALAGLTVVSAGATVWSGLDAEANPGKDAVVNECKGKGDSCSVYRQGLAAQLRTNVLLGATGVFAVSAAVVGLFFTDWSTLDRSRPKVGAQNLYRVEPMVGPLSAGLRGSF